MGSKVGFNEKQGVLQPQGSVADSLYDDNGVVIVQKLNWPNFDPERPVTMGEYLAEIGERMADEPRETGVEDGALGVYRADFERANPKNLKRGLYFPRLEYGQRPTKGVVRVAAECTLTRNEYPGVQPASSRLAVPEDISRAIVENAPYYANSIANTTEGANLDNTIVENREDLGGESVFYALTREHEILESYDEVLLEERAGLLAVRGHLVADTGPKRIKNLEQYRMLATSAVQEMVRIACRGQGYGTNDTKNTLNATTSNIYRSERPADWLAAYTHLAILYNDAMRGKINQSINGIMAELSQWAPHVINNIDRVYEDKPRKKA